MVELDPKLESLIDLISGYYGIQRRNFVSRARTRNLVDARNMYYLVARTITGASYAQIGQTVGRDHSTVIHGTHTVEWAVQHDRQVEEDFRHLSLVGGIKTTATMTRGENREVLMRGVRITGIGLHPAICLTGLSVPIRHRPEFNYRDWLYESRKRQLQRR